ncbi:MAG: fumarylacetoacetate hydrolase family protein, partial [Caulobacteraceae bacterium]
MIVDETHDADRRSWVESANAAGTDFPIQNLPLCIFHNDGHGPRGGIGIGDQILDLKAASKLGLFSGDAAQAAEAACEATLNSLMAMGPRYSSALRRRVSQLLSTDAEGEPAKANRERLLVPMTQAQLELPAFIHSFSDFTSSVDHTKRLRGHIPDVLMRLPVAYHGRASSIRLDGTPVLRPYGQFKAADESSAYGPEPRLDFELEFAAFVGMPSTLGEPVPVRDAAEHIFGFVLLNDWSARGI